jgi:hypothetical protein
MQTAPPTPIPIEWFRGIFRNLFSAVEALRPHGRLPAPLIALVLQRLHRIYHLVIRITALVQTGHYRPRRSSGRPRRQAVRRTRPPSPLPPKRGWLAALLPEAAPGCRGTLDNLLRQPDMIELIGAAPTMLIPPLRSLCWALQLEPPAILARPRRPAPPPEPPRPTATAAPQPPAEPSAPPGAAFPPPPPAPADPPAINPPKTA